MMRNLLLTLLLLCGVAYGQTGVGGIKAYPEGGTGKTSWTAGSVPFAGATAFGEDNSKLFWDDSNKAFIIGANSLANTNLDLQVWSSGVTRIGAVSDGASGQPSFQGWRSRGTLGSPTAVQDGDILALLQGIGTDSDGDYGSAGYISLYADGAPGATYVSGGMEIGITDATGTTKDLQWWRAAEKIQYAANFEVARTDFANIDTASDILLKIHRNADPGAWTAASDTDAQDIYYRTASGGAHVAGNPRGGDIVLVPGAAGSGGAGRAGRVDIQGALRITDDFALTLGTDLNATITYDEATDDRVEVAGADWYLGSGVSLGIDDLTASRLCSTDGSKNLASVADLTSWIAGTSGEITSTSDSDGTLTLSLPDTVNLGASGILRTGSGAEATPAITDESDTNTGIWYPAADTWAVSNNGSESMRLTSTGQMLVGTTSSSAKLSVATSASFNASAFVMYVPNTSFTDNVSYFACDRTSSSAFTLVSTANGGGFAHKLYGDGTANADGAWSSTGVDYAEYFEWHPDQIVDGLPNDVAGYAIELVDHRVRIATATTDPARIIGIVSVTPSFIGGDPLRHPDQYIYDRFGRRKKDGTGADMRNPNYIKLPKKYERRKDDRFVCVGLIGQLPLLSGEPVNPRWIKMRDTQNGVSWYLVR